MGDYSSFLFAGPSFLEGMGRVLDFGDTMTEFNRSPTPAMADELALHADWMQVGQDVKNAFECGVDNVEKICSKETPS